MAVSIASAASPVAVDASIFSPLNPPPLDTTACRTAKTSPAANEAAAASATAPATATSRSPAPACAE
eukprot:scaffold552687_cov23-Prasinocladus_malaysianus.AAC.1